jgi:hypothetical protein
MDDQAQGNPEEKTPATTAQRAPYARPALKEYGDVAALTRSVGKTGTVADGGHGAMSKTS